jgi:hypothetical protein
MKLQNQNKKNGDEIIACCRVSRIARLRLYEHKKQGSLLMQSTARIE